MVVMCSNGTERIEYEVFEDKVNLGAWRVEFDVYSECQTLIFAGSHCEKMAKEYGAFLKETRPTEEDWF